MTHSLHAASIERLLRAVPAQPPFPPASDRRAWQAAAARLSQDVLREFMQQAETAAGAPIPPLPATLWLQCQRTGQREGYEDPCYRRRLLMRDLALGECLEYQGRFLDALMDVIWAICEESSWVYPAHQLALPDPAHPYIDLGAAGTAFDLAAVDGLLGQALPAEVGQRIRYEVNQRLLVPYLERHDFWWLHGQPDHPLNNWTAVCNAGVMAAALYLEPDPARLAAILEKGMRSLGEYLATFDQDGGTSEGLGYWSYGFGHYVLIAHLIEQRSAGKITLMDGEQIRKIAAFPLRTMLSQGSYVNFSDASAQASFISAMLTYLGRRFDLPGLLALARAPHSNRRDGLNADFCWRLRALFWDLPEPGSGGVVPARHDWYEGMLWMIARCDPEDPDGLVLAAKGGHNDEMHNHNDIGTFIVQTQQEALVCDLGSGRYTRQYFGEERYQHMAASALGHSLPVPNGQLQQAGSQFTARLLEHDAGDDQDVLRLDLREAYPAAAGLAALERRLVLHRPGPHAGALPSGWVELEDSFAFQHTAGAFESALVTCGQVILEDGAVLLQGARGALRVRYAAEEVSVRVEVYPKVVLAEGQRDVQRVVFFLKEPRKTGRIRLEIVPGILDF